MEIHQKWILFLVFIIFASCKNDTEPTVVHLEQEIEDLKNQLTQSDQDIRDFSMQYKLVSESLDSIRRVSDSLQEINLDGIAFDADSLAYYRSQFVNSEALIADLEQKLSSMNPNSEVTNLLEYQLSRTRSQLQQLEIENQQLVGQNDSIKNLLNLAQNQLEKVKEDLVSSRNEIIDKEALYQQEIEKQRQETQAREDEIKRLETSNRTMITNAESQYEKALIELRNLDLLIKLKKDGSYKIRNRDLDNSKTMITNAVRYLSEAKREGFSRANELLNEIYYNKKYAEIRPIQ